MLIKNADETLALLQFGATIIRPWHDPRTSGSNIALRPDRGNLMASKSGALLVDQIMPSSCKSLKRFIKASCRRYSRDTTSYSRIASSAVPINNTMAAIQTNRGAPKKRRGAGPISQFIDCDLLRSPPLFICYDAPYDSLLLASQGRNWLNIRSTSRTNCDARSTEHEREHGARSRINESWRGVRAVLTDDSINAPNLRKVRDLPELVRSAAQTFQRLWNSRIDYSNGWRSIAAPVI